MQHLLTTRNLWLILALVCFILAVASLVLTHILHLNPCYLCVFQRFLYLIIAIGATIAALSSRRSVSIVFGVLVLICAICGTGVAGYQVWLQSRPGAEFMCAGGDPNMIESIVTWLNAQIPVVFLATGNCVSKELVIFGIALAGWSFIGFIAGLSTAVWALLRSRS